MKTDCIFKHKNLALLLISILLLPAKSLLASEVIEYQAIYKGVFSMYNEWTIADVNLSVSPIAETHQDWQKITLTVSSENHATVERLYPFRYAFDSYLASDPLHTSAFEHLKSSGKKSPKHYIGLIDAKRGDVQLFQADQHRTILSSSVLNALKTQGIKADEIVSLGLQAKGQRLEQINEAPLDRLSMLTLIQQQVKQGRKQSQDYLVTNGSKLMLYRVSPLKREKISISATSLLADKVKIEAFVYGEPQLVTDDSASEYLLHSPQQKPNYVHAPVYAWFATDGSATPLKFVSKHAVGEFQVVITDYKQLENIATNY